MHRTPARLALAAVLAVLALLGLAPPLEAAREPKIPESMLAVEAGCGPGDEGRLIAIVDASAADDCDQTPEAVPASYVTARCICNHGTLEAVAAEVDVSGKANLSGATFTGATSVNVSGGAVEFSVASGSVAFGGDLVVASGEQLRGNGASPAKIDLDTGSFALTVDPSGSAANVILDSTSSLGEKVLRLRSYLRIVGEDTLPPCDASLTGTITFDKSSSEFCGCNGSAWAALDGSGTCA